MKAEPRISAARPEPRPLSARNALYRCLYTSGTASTRQDLASALHLSLPTVQQNVTELLQQGLIRYGCMQQSTGGRRAAGLEIEPAARFAVGVSLTKEHLRFYAADLQLGEMAYRKTQSLPLNTSEDLGALLRSELEQFLNDYRLDRQRLLGVGLAVPAVLDADAGRIVRAPTLQLRNNDLTVFQRALPYPCHIENDANCGGLTECFETGEKNLAYLSLEDGVGGALLLDGRLYAGQNRRSGEFGHLCVQPNGLRCRCGKNGCLEAYCSALRLGADRGGEPEEFFAGLERGDPGCRALWEDFLSHLAIGVSNIHTALDCDVVLGGFMTQYLEPYFGRLQALAAELNPFEYSAGYMRLSRRPHRAVVRGAALFFVRSFIENI